MARNEYGELAHLGVHTIMKRPLLFSCCRIAILLLFFLALFLPLSSVRGEDLLQLYQRALDKDPQLRGASFEHLALKESVKQARARMMPVVALEGTGSQTYQDIVQSSNPVFASGYSDYQTKTYTARVTQPLFRYSLLVELSQAKNVSKRADINLGIAKQDLIIRLAQGYVAAQTASDNIAYLKEEKKDVEAFFDRAKARYDAGLAPVTDVYDARARLASVEASLVKAENEHRDALQALAEITGSSSTSIVAFKDDLPLVSPTPADPAEWAKSGVDNNLKIKGQKLDAEVSRQEVTRQKSAHYPNLDLQARYNRNDMGGSLYGGGAIVDTKDVVLTLTIPVFEGLGIQSKTREAKDRYLKNMEILEQQKRSVIRQANASFNGINTAISRAEALRKSIEAQTELVAAKEKGYKSGVYTSLAVLDAARDLYLYRRDYSTSRYDYIINTLKLKQAVGTLSESDIAAVNGWLQ
jgi:outer membrane protein